MRRLFTLLTGAVLLAMLAACGAAEAPTATTAPPTATVAPTATVVPPTATVAPTATVVPPTATVAPTATVPPTATVAPTRAAASPTAPAATGGSSVVDSSGKCRMTLPSAFKASGASAGTYATADSLALLTFTGTDTPGLSLDAATGAFIQGFQTVVTGYAETGRQTSKDARGDIQVVTFTGAISQQQAKGVFYFVQNGSVLCSLVALAIPPGDAQYGDAAQQAAESLQVIKPTTYKLP